VLKPILDVWESEVGCQEVSATEVLKKAGALIQEAVGRSFTSQSFGRFIEPLRNRTIGRLTLRSRLDLHAKIRRYRLERKPDAT